MSLDLHWPALTEALVVWYAACYGRTRATGDMAPYPGDAALALMQTIFICLWRLADVHRELAQATDMLTHFHALHRDRATAAKAKESLKPAQSLMDTIKNAISKPRCSSVLVAQLAHVAHVAHVVRAILKQNHDVGVDRDALSSSNAKQADVKENNLETQALEYFPVLYHPLQLLDFSGLVQKYVCLACGGYVRTPSGRLPLLNSKAASLLVTLRQASHHTLTMSRAMVSFLHRLCLILYGAFLP